MLSEIDVGRRDDVVVVHPVWPLFDLEVVTPRLTLRYIDDDLGSELAELAADGIHDPATMPFAVPWTDTPPPDLQRDMFRYWWHCRATTTREHWELNFGVLVDGAVVGATNLSSNEFATGRSFSTGSWLGRRFQGRGTGTELRAATLHLGFAGFDAEVATTAAFADNAASLGVTRRLGYEQTGSSIELRRGEPAEQHQFRLKRTTWDRHRRHDVVIHGLGPVRALLAI